MSLINPYFETMDTSMHPKATHSAIMTSFLDNIFPSQLIRFLPKYKLKGKLLLQHLFINYLILDIDVAGSTSYEAFRFARAYSLLEYFYSRFKWYVY